MLHVDAGTGIEVWTNISDLSTPQVEAMVIEKVKFLSIVALSKSTCLICTAQIVTSSALTACAPKLPN